MLVRLKEQLLALARKLGLVREPHEAMRTTADEPAWSAGTPYQQFQKPVSVEAEPLTESPS